MEHTKLKSRTFWMTVVWTCFIPLSFVAQLLIPTFEIPISTIVTLAGSITLVYIGGNKAATVVDISKKK